MDVHQGWQLTRLESLRKRREVLKAALLSANEENDHHGVSDFANDLREVEAEERGYKAGFDDGLWMGGIHSEASRPDVDRMPTIFDRPLGSDLHEGYRGLAQREQNRSTITGEALDPLADAILNYEKATHPVPGLKGARCAVDHKGGPCSWDRGL